MIRVGVGVTSELGAESARDEVVGAAALDRAVGRDGRERERREEGGGAAEEDDEESLRRRTRRDARSS
eukprot:2655313-Prymnesium_polylepis.1